MQETLSDSRCRSLSFRQGMQETLYQTEDAGKTLSAADAGVSPSDSGCRRLSIRQSLLHMLSDRVFPATAISYQTESLLHMLSDRVSPATAI